MDVSSTFSKFRVMEQYNKIQKYPSLKQNIIAQQKSEGERVSDTPRCDIISSS
jgi:hypothetical protein